MRALFLIFLLGATAMALDEKPPQDVKGVQEEEMTVRLVVRAQDENPSIRVGLQVLELVWICTLFIMSLLSTELLRRSLTMTRQINRLLHTHTAARAGYYQFVAPEEKKPVEKEAQWYN